MIDADPSAPSPRMALADIAERAVARMPGVALSGAQHAAWQTVDGDRRIRGVTAVVQADGRFELGLHVVVSWPPEPLLALAEDLRRRVHTAAKRARVDDRLGEIHIDIVSVLDPDELGPGGRS